MKQPTQIFPCPYQLPCEIHGCYNRSKWFIGRPDVPLSTTLRICDNCAREMLANIPDELTDSVVIEKADMIQLALHDETSHAPVDEIETDETLHVQEKPPDETFSCPDCGSIFQSERALKIHISKQHDAS